MCDYRIFNYETIAKTQDLGISHDNVVKLKEKRIMFDNNLNVAFLSNDLLYVFNKKYFYILIFGSIYIFLFSQKNKIYISPF